ncbi:IS5 family transposase ISOt6 [Orientia tsutsugamushi]|nr:DDE superendonuclease family protein [Orientia tsutsugamushi str. TA763]KJV76611.1 DDE superendonuclease family protein [Orientia tsutsugamushi str. UT76]SPP23866.1 IS5 family transposase ISOt6 [Orientia tsutsugamushi]SPR03982.1 IS5 family transposase ISOt6 [Orientia tsutsugamushi]
MVDILRKADGLKKSKSWRKNKLNLKEQLLMALEYLREYRTYFHKWVEDTLVNKHPNFALPGRVKL